MSPSFFCARFFQQNDWHLAHILGDQARKLDPTSHHVWQKKRMNLSYLSLESKIWRDLVVSWFKSPNFCSQMHRHNMTSLIYAVN